MECKVPKLTEDRRSILVEKEMKAALYFAPQHVFLLFCAVGASLSASPARSQAGFEPPKLQPKVDANGINISSGNFPITPNFPLLAIGGNGKEGLEFRISGDFRLNNNVNVVLGPVFGNPNPFYITPIGTDKFQGDGVHSDDRTGNVIDNGVFIDRNGNEARVYGHPEGAKVRFASGETWEYYYESSSSPRVISIVSNLGYQLKFSYNASNPACNQNVCTPATITAVNTAYDYCAPAAPTCTGTSYQWPTVTQSSSYVQNISTSMAVNSMNIVRADGANFLLSRPGASLTNPITLQLPGRSPVVYTFASNKLNSEKRYVDTQDGRWTYQRFNEAYATYATVTNPLGAQVKYSYSTDSYSGRTEIVSYTDEIGRVTSYSYDDYGRAIRVSLPSGSSETFLYDDRANILRKEIIGPLGTGNQTLTWSAVYPTQCLNYKTCNKPLSITDPSGNTTTFTYDGNHGGVLTETSPSVNGVASVNRYTYAQRFALIKNSGANGWNQASSPVWVLTEKRTCRSTATVNNACSGGAADEVVTSYDYGPSSGGPNNLQLRGVTVISSDGVQRSCFTYDRMGRRSSESTPNAGLSAC